MEEVNRILLECRYLISLNKNYLELASIFHISYDMVYDDLNNKLPKIDKVLYKRIQNVLNRNNES